MEIAAAGLALATRSTGEVERASRALAQATRSVSSAGPGDVVDLTAEMVALLAASRAHETAAGLIGVGEEMDRRVLDLLG